MEITDRFSGRWVQWDAQLREGEDAAKFLKGVKDEELLELLAGASERDRKYERDVVATEIQNRLAQRAKEHPESAEGVFRAAYNAYEAMAEAQKPIHTAEGILKARGDVELGVAVSASAIVSFDAAKLAMEAAQAHVAELKAAQAQSRIAERLVEDAAQAALEAAAEAERGAGRIEELGHEAEARAARAAAKKIRDAAEAAARKLRAANDSSRVPRCEVRSPAGGRPKRGNSRDRTTILKARRTGGAPCRRSRTSARVKTSRERRSGRMFSGSRTPATFPLRCSI